jgi:3-phosphoshikimate 1-carboxyvinyltransferase
VEPDLERIHRLDTTRSETFEASIPGSKSYTNRALLLAAMRHGESAITGALHCDDTRYLSECLDAFDGLAVKPTADGFEVRREPRRLRAPSAELFVGAAGTPARFLLSFAASADGSTVVTGTPRLCERPMDDLLEALRRLGVECECLAREGCLPVRVRGTPDPSGRWSIHGGVSSQFLSSLLLFASQQPEGPIEVGVTGHLVSRPYVRMTLSMLGAQGIAAEESAPDRFVIEPGMPRGPEIPIEVDASGMSYFLVAAAITQTSVRIDGIGAKSAQGDVGLAQALADMGCELEISDDYLILQGRPLHGIQVDMETMPDVVLSLAIAAALAEGETRITNIANLRIKECDRIRAAATELQRLGIAVEEGDDFLVIQPDGCNIAPARIETYDDHRVAMSFGLLRLLYDGIEIEDPACVAKSFPGFWNELARFVEHHEP